MKNQVFETPFVQIDHFLTLEEHRQLLDYALQRESSFVPSGVLTAELNYRKSVVLFSFPEFSHLIASRIQDIFAHLLIRLDLPSFQISQIEAQLTAHNDGGYYKVHTDSGCPVTKFRLLTYIYYFYREPKAFSGGCLKLYDTTVVDNQLAAADSFKLIEPRNNSIVFFFSRRFHEVLPISCPSRAFADSRFTINGWIHGLRPKKDGCRTPLYPSLVTCQL